MIVKLLTEYNLKFLSLKGGCRGSSESTLVIMSNYWKSHATTHMINVFIRVKEETVVIVVNLVFLEFQVTV